MPKRLTPKERKVLFKKADKVRNLYQADTGKRIDTPIIKGKAVNPITGRVYDLRKKKAVGNARDLGLV